jgi:hypothetical protein
MTPPKISTIDMRVIESVLEMGGGYVLDFSNRTFSAFFKDFGVDIERDDFSLEGTSKANRLRCFLHRVSPPLSGKVLAALLELRLMTKPDGLKPGEVDRYRIIAASLGGPSAPSGVQGSTVVGEADAEAVLLRHVFKPEAIRRLAIDEGLAQALIDRMDEASRCIDAKAYLSAVILCGSVLEGMCLGFGLQYREHVNRAYAALFKRDPKSLHDWRLAEWIDVLAGVGHLSPNVQKFGHGLRDFRNYVHPAEQIANRFVPDQHTARIAFHVVAAAADSLANARVT